MRQLHTYDTTCSNAGGDLVYLQFCELDGPKKLLELMCEKAQVRLLELNSQDPQTTYTLEDLDSKDYHTGRVI